MGRQDYETETETETVIAHALRADGFDASEDGTGRGTPIVPVIPFDTTNMTSPGNYSHPKPGDPMHPLTTAGHVPAVAFDMRGRDGSSQFEGPHDTANMRAASGGSSRSYVAGTWAVRRLMPVECERLQGFPDGYTDVPYRGKPAADGPRYKALGNSFAVNTVRWIGRRIQMVDELVGSAAA
jgi:DNA (cytosine-5)-methyltransferase 1